MVLHQFFLPEVVKSAITVHTYQRYYKPQLDPRVFHFTFHFTIQINSSCHRRHFLLVMSDFCSFFAAFFFIYENALTIMNFIAFYTALFGVDNACILWLCGFMILLSCFVGACIDQNLKKLIVSTPKFRFILPFSR